MSRYRIAVAIAATVASIMSATMSATVRAHAQSEIVPGTVVVLSGTAHVWVADDGGILHWAGDTRALAGRAANWDLRREVHLADLLAMPRGAPWLSSGLLKVGDPVYLVKWETSETSPTLNHVASVRDLELFGIDDANWGSLVYDQALWERRFGISISSLARKALPRATVPEAFTALVPASPDVPRRAPTPDPSPSSVPLTATPDTHRLNRTPLVRADGDLPLGVGDGWTDGIAVGARDHRLDVPYSSHMLASWTVRGGGSPTYATVVAVNLDYNKDVISIPALARKVFKTYCADVTKCDGVDGPVGALTVGGMSALRYDTRSRVEYWSTPDGGGAPAFIQHEWVATHLFFLRGEWGYEIRVFSEDPSTFAATSADFIAAVGKVQFRKV